MTRKFRNILRPLNLTSIQNIKLSLIMLLLIVMLPQGGNCFMGGGFKNLGRKLNIIGNAVAGLHKT